MATRKRRFNIGDTVHINVPGYRNDENWQIIDTASSLDFAIIKPLDRQGEVVANYQGRMFSFDHLRMIEPAPPTNDQALIQDATKRAARATKITPDRIQRVRLDLRKLREAGILVEVRVSGTSIFTRRTTRAELGITADDIRLNYMTSGATFRINPVQARRMKSLEVRFHQILTRYSYGLEGFRPKRFIPFTAFDRFNNEFTRLKAQWDTIKQEILAQRQEHMDKVEEEWAKIAAESWASIMSKRNRGLAWSFDQSAVPPVRVDGRAFELFEDFARYLIGRAVAGVPSDEEIADALQVRYDVSIIAMTSQIEQEFVECERARLEQEAARYERERAWLAQNQTTRRMQAEHQAQLDRISAETRLFEENMRAQLRDMTSPYEQMFDQLREMMLQDAQAVLEGIAANGRLVGPSATRARSMIDTFKLLNASDDQELGALIDQLAQRIDTKVEVDTDNGYRMAADTRGVAQVADAIVTLCHRTASATRRTQRQRGIIKQQPASAAQLEKPDLPRRKTRAPKGLGNKTAG